MPPSNPCGKPNNLAPSFFLVTHGLYFTLSANYWIGSELAKEYAWLTSTCGVCATTPFVHAASTSQWHVLSTSVNGLDFRVAWGPFILPMKLLSGGSLMNAVSI